MKGCAVCEERMRVSEVRTAEGAVCATRVRLAAPPPPEAGPVRGLSVRRRDSGECRSAVPVLGVSPGGRGVAGRCPWVGAPRAAPPAPGEPGWGHVREGPALTEGGGGRAPPGRPGQRPGRRAGSV